MKIVPPSTIAALLLALLLSGCGWVYKADVQQGNIIDAAAVEKLRIGMDKRQVRFLIGGPAVKDLFHAARWDYIYYMKPGRGEPELESLTLYFEGDKLVRIERRAAEGEAGKG